MATKAVTLAILIDIILVGVAVAGPGVHEVPAIVGSLGGTKLPIAPLRQVAVVSKESLTEKALASLRELVYARNVNKTSPSGDQRVAFGDYASSVQFPWAVRLDIEKDDGSRSLCGGSLISPRAIITAAHCLYEDNSRPVATNINAYIGDTDMEKPSIPITGKFFMSAGYAPSRTGNQLGDLALIELSAPSASTPVPYDDGNDFNPERTFVTIGWGMTEDQELPNALKWTTVPGIPDSAYKKWMTSWSAKEGVSPLVLEPDHLVAGLGAPRRADACLGDSGGALILPGPGSGGPASDRDILVGLVSYGLTSECGSEVNIGMYTKMGYWRTWVDDALSIYNLRGTSAPLRQCGVPSNTCLTGGELSKVANVASAGPCCDACRDNAGCYAWSWEARSKICSLKKKTGYKLKSGDCTSAPMQGTRLATTGRKLKLAAT